MRTKSKQEKLRDYRFWLPLSIALLAAGFSGLQWYEAHQHKRLQIRPLLNFYIQDDETDKIVGMRIDNNGPGTAVIKRITYFVDHRSMADAYEALSHSKLNPDLNHGIEFEEGDALGGGQTAWLFDYRTKDNKDKARFSEFLNEHLTAEVTYCSVDDECWKKCSRRGYC